MAQVAADRWETRRMWHLQETNLQFQLQIQEEGNLDLRAGNHALQSSNDFGCCALENLYVDQIHQDFMERNQTGSGIILSGVQGQSSERKWQQCRSLLCRTEVYAIHTKQRENIKAEFQEYSSVLRIGPNSTMSRKILLVSKIPFA